MKIRQYIELAVNGCDCRECLDAIIRTAEEESAAELATLRAENERLRDALAGMIKYGHETRGIRVLEAFNKAKEALK